jgi:hypothetical protein
MNTISKIPATKQEVETAIEKAVDTIADMIGKGFAPNDMRFDAIEWRLGKIENLLIEEQSGNWRAWKHGSNTSKTPSL